MKNEAAQLQKYYISVDMEGLAGIATWGETTSTKPEYQTFKDEMTREVVSACNGIAAAEALSGHFHEIAGRHYSSEIWIKDAHDTGMNLNPSELPANTRLVRGFNGHPFCMMQELDKSFKAALMIGYHSYAGSDGSPLSHTLHPELTQMKINGQAASEFLVNAYTAALSGVPVAFVSGDEALCQHIKSINPNIKTVATIRGAGESITTLLHPAEACEAIKAGVEESLKGDLSKYRLVLPEKFEVEMSFSKHTKAYRASFYPGMEKESPLCLKFRATDYFDVLRMFNFVLNWQ
ncbi:MAG: amino acid amidase [Clostridiales bacterium]|nr:amino acid amidase [Clostridiales bacterium]